MAIEREFKYVLDRAAPLEEELKNQATSSLLTIYEVDQGYLSKGGRVRRKSYSFKAGLPNTDVEYIFTYKQKLIRQPGCLEIETELTQADFDIAWSISDHLITKTRYVIECKNKLFWEIDFFKDTKGTYFALAECEVEPSQDRPTMIHPLVEKYLIFEVPESDSRFQNRKLSDRKKVIKALSEVQRDVKTKA